MGYCPILSFKVSTISRVSSNATGVVYNNSGSDAGDPPTWNNGTESVVYVPTALTPDQNDTINYKTDVGTPGTFDANGFFQCPQSNDCQLWDNKNARCGAKTADYIYDSSQSDATAVLNVIKSVIGDYDDRDGLRSLYQWGKDIFGTASERDAGNSLVTWLNSVIGVISEKDDSNSLIKWLQEMLGDTTERDAGNSLVAWLQSILGAIAEKDDGHSFMTWAQNILGVDDEIGTTWNIGSLLKTAVHEHDYHHHGMQDFEHLTVTWIPIIQAMILAAEFMANQDLDNDRGPVIQPVGWGSIFGTDFMITNDANCPPAIKAIYEHPEWSDPALSVTWSTYTDTWTSP